MRSNNIHQFRGNPTLINRIAAAFVYLVLGYTITAFPPSAIFSIYFVLGLLYFLVIHRQRASIKYFVRYHLVQAFFLNVCLSMLLWLLTASVSFLSAFPGLDIAGEFITYYLFQYPVFVSKNPEAFSPSVINVLLMCTSLVMAVYSLLGKFTEVPYVSDAVRRFD
jgi:hypothetical protein